MDQMPDDSPQHSDPQRVRLGVLCDCLSVRWWEFLVHSFSKVVVVEALWAPNEKLCEDIAKSVSPKNIRLYWSTKTEPPENSDHDFEDLVLHDSINALFIDISSPIHAEILSRLLQHPQFNKHIFSTTLPSYKSSEMIELLEKRALKKDILWHIADAFRYDAWVIAVTNLLHDIGTLVGASIQGSQLPCMPDSISNSDDEILLRTTYNYIGLLRTILGHVYKACCIKNKPTKSSIETLVGWILFTNGAQCIVRFTSSRRSTMDLRIWGTLGHISVSWITNKQHFEIQRYLKHFENPTSLYSSGIQNSLANWIYFVQKNEKLRTDSTIEQTANLAVATSMLTSNGVVIHFKSTQLREITHQ